MEIEHNNKCFWNRFARLYDLETILDTKINKEFFRDAKRMRVDGNAP